MARKVTIENSYEETSYPELSKEEKSLMDEAIRSAEYAHAPFSSYHVGCALLLADKQIIGGSNQENASFPVGLCAERIALSAYSASKTEQPIIGLAIAVSNQKKAQTEIAAPCGICRQTILDYQERQGQPFYILLKGSEEMVYRIDRIEDIFPLGFSYENL